jgi:hypothetical protein
MRVKASTTLLQEELWESRKRQGAEAFEWYVFFLDTDRSQWKWWHWFCREGFAHVSALRYDPKSKVWILLDWNSAHLESKVVNRDDVELFFGQLYHGASCVRMKPLWRPAGPPRSSLMYCVTAIKHLMGIDCWAVTPYQLYSTLIRNGAIEVWPAITSEASALALEPEPEKSDGIRSQKAVTE